MTTYDPNLSLGEAVKQYFIANNFGDDGGYGDRWVEVKLGPIPFYILNAKSRVRAVRFHDLHHILTGYETNLVGEFEISAWELASFCADMHAAWVLNMSGLVGGFLLWPRRTLHAFLRGRNSRNLYRESYSPELLAMKVKDVKAKLGLDKDEVPAMRGRDALLLIGYLLLGMPISLALLLLGIAFSPLALLQNALGFGRAARA